MTDSYVPRLDKSDPPVQTPPTIPNSDSRRTIIALTSAACISIALVALLMIFDVR